MHRQATSIHPTVCSVVSTRENPWMTVSKAQHLVDRVQCQLGVVRSTLSTALGASSEQPDHRGSVAKIVVSRLGPM